MYKALLRKTRGSLLAGGASSFLLIGLGLFYSYLSQQVHDLDHRLAHLNRLAVRSQAAAALLESHKEDFVHFEACRFEEVQAPGVLQALQVQDMELGPAHPLSEENTAGFIRQDVILSIPCLHDGEIFALIEQMICQGPGVFQIQEVKIERVGIINDGFLEKIKAGASGKLFEGSLKAVWIHR